MKKKYIPGIPTAAVALLLAGGVAFAQSGPGKQDNSDSKPAAVTSQAATTAPDGAAAQPSAATPADPVKVTPTAILIEDVRGTVRYQANDDAPKVIAKKGDKLQEGVKFSLGFHRSEVQLLVGDGQQLTFDQAGIYVVDMAVNDGTTDRTHIKLDSGRVSFDVKKVRFANHVLIETPTMVLAITGTSGFVEYIPGQPVIAAGAEENRGHIEVNYKDSGQRVTMTRNEMSTSVSPEPAVMMSQMAMVDQSSAGAREHDEARLMRRTEGGTQPVQLELGEVNSTRSQDNLMDMITQPGDGTPGGGTGTGTGTPGPTGTVRLDNPGVGLSRLDGSGNGGNSMSPSTRAPQRPPPSSGRVSAVEVAAYNARLGRALAAWQASRGDAMDRPSCVANLLKRRDLKIPVQDAGPAKCDKNLVGPMAPANAALRQRK